MIVDSVKLTEPDFRFHIRGEGIDVETYVNPIQHNIATAEFVASTPNLLIAGRINITDPERSMLRNALVFMIDQHVLFV